MHKQGGRIYENIHAENFGRNFSEVNSSAETPFPVEIFRQLGRITSYRNGVVWQHLGEI